MTAADLAAALLATDDLTVVPVATPEWPAIDGQIHVRLLSAGGRWRYLRGLQPVIAAGEALSEDGLVRESGVRLAAATLCDAAGALLFPDTLSPTTVMASLKALTDKAWEPMQRVIDATAALNKFDGKAVEDTKKKLGTRDGDVRFEYRLAGYLGTTRKQLHRELDADEWLDWRVLEAIDPFGERREDLRIALLAQVLVGALGTKKLDGQPFLAADFQRLLPGGADEVVTPVAPITQTADQVEMRLDSWISGSNQVIAEGGGRR